MPVNTRCDVFSVDPGVGNFVSLDPCRGRPPANPHGAEKYKFTISTTFVHYACAAIFMAA
jgi:hypothetical protein